MIINHPRRPAPALCASAPSRAKTTHLALNFEISNLKSQMIINHPQCPAPALCASAPSRAKTTHLALDFEISNFK
jgi:hypothetical protein